MEFIYRKPVYSIHDYGTINVTLEPGGQDTQGVRSDPALYLGSKLKLEQ